MKKREESKKYFNFVNNRFYYDEIKTKNVSDTIPPGYYYPDSDMNGMYLRSIDAPQEDLSIDISSGPVKEIMKDINTFLSSETQEAFKKYDMLYRRGILVHGSPGTGKSVIFRNIAKRFVADGGICFWDIPPGNIAGHTEHIRDRVKDQKILVIWEEIEEWLCDYEHQILQLLDGHLTLNNAVYLASTNYIDEIPARLKNRPSRIARVVEVGPPTAKVRKEFFTKRVLPEDLQKLGDKGLDELVEKTEGLVIDHLKELIVSVFCMKVPMDDALVRVREMNIDDVDDEETVVSEVCKEEPVEACVPCSPPKGGW